MNFFLWMTVWLITALSILPSESLSAQIRYSRQDEAKLAKIPFDGKAAYQTLHEICKLGPRVTGSAAMVAQQKMLIKHFTRLGATIKKQSFQIAHPENGKKTSVMNLIVQWHPDKKDRLVLCCHYDTRPFPDNDPINPKGIFLGANDGASGVALFHELGKLMPELSCKYGVDFVFFDAEELVYERRRDPLFIGSNYFSNDYVKNPPAYRYVSGVLIDMIGDANLNLFYEKNSMRFAPQLTKGIWGTARKLGVREFVPRERHLVRDDHLPMNEIARIPTTDIIDFDYPTPGARNAYWHTEKDIPENCSAVSLAKVGWVLKQWLQDVQ